MDTNDKTKCECYCHKKGAHCCDGGSGSCALCGEISDWAIKELVPPPVTASLETGGWEEEFDVKNKEHWGIGSVGAFDIKDFIRKTITHTNASVTEQTERKVREEIEQEYERDTEEHERLLEAIKNKETLYVSEFGSLLCEEDYLNFEEWVDSVGKPEGSSSEQFYKLSFGSSEQPLEKEQ